MDLCFATNNKHKLGEVRQAVGDAFKILSLEELSVFDDLPETHNTLEGNAMQKALFIYNKMSVPCFADDSGLEVDALNGQPGVYSARYAGPQRNDDDNIEKLLGALADQTNRKAKFRTVIALVGLGPTQMFEGVIEGRITERRSGSQGFGYDPVFQPDQHTRTFAEMSLDEKNKLSHRAKAVAKLIGYLESVKR